MLQNSLEISRVIFNVSFISFKNNISFNKHVQFKCTFSQCYQSPLRKATAESNGKELQIFHIHLSSHDNQVA